MRVIPVLHDGTLAVVSVFQTDLMDVSKLGSKIVSHNEVLGLKESSSSSLGAMSCDVGNHGSSHKSIIYICQRLDVTG